MQDSKWVHFTNAELTHGISANLLKHFDMSLIHCVCILVYYWLRMHILICYFASIILQQWAERPGQQGGVDVGHRHCRVSLTFDCCVLFLSGRSFSLGGARLQRQRKRQRCTPHTCLGNKRDRSPLHECRSAKCTRKLHFLFLCLVVQFAVSLCFWRVSLDLCYITMEMK